MVYTYTIDEIPMETGDLIGTIDGGDSIVAGQFWRLIGKRIPGEVDHVVIYVGPEGRCIEAGPKGVITFDVMDNTWDAERMSDTRGMLDYLHGVAYPLKGRDLSEDEVVGARTTIADYCVTQVGKHYNVNFLDSDTEGAFYYCSQLAYKAYLPHGIDLNTSAYVPDIPGTDGIIYLQEIWSGCAYMLLAA